MNFILSLIVGALAGYIAGRIMKSSGGIIRNIILGVVGSAVGGFLASLLGLYAKTFSIGGLIISVAGACLVIWIGRKLFKN